MPQHTISQTTNYLVFVVLIGLTIMTVGISFIHIDETWHTVIGLGIAGGKALLVALFFMHVLYSTRLTWLIVAGSLLWLGILISYTLTDYLTRGWLSY